MRKVDENWFGNVVKPNKTDVADVIYNLLTLEKLRSIPVVFNVLCSRTPRYNFASTLYPKVVGVKFKLYTVCNLHLK
jgi:hypothetical protein